MADDQVGPQGIHHPRRFGKRMGRRDREPQFRQNRFTALPAFRVLVDKKNERCESLPISDPAAAARAVTAIRPLPLVRYTGDSWKRYDGSQGDWFS